MLVNIDAKQLEWVAAVYLSQDTTGIQEILSGHDQHSDNERRFGLPSRLIAKTLLFRTIYGGTGYSFANDPKFSGIGSESWWDEKISEFYAKYKGLCAWHTQLMQRVIRTDGLLEMPTGRVYEFEPIKQRGELKWPRTQILNYPVQGFAADLMSIVRVSMRKRLRTEGILFTNTVHDSVVLDITQEIWDNNSEAILLTVEGVFEDVPKNFHKLFGVELNIPVRCDIDVGMNWKDMKSYKELN